jgi:hypothetical protein
MIKSNFQGVGQVFKKLEKYETTLFNAIFSLQGRWQEQT